MAGFESLLANTGQPPLIQLDHCDAIFQRKDDGTRKSGAHEALSVPYDNVAAKDFTLRGTKGCGHI